ncbi:MAG: hypothetical protein AABW47_02245 [Nanoarchaeota archaeon]
MWDKETNLGTSDDCNLPSSCDESPYGIFIRLNSQEGTFQTEEEYSEKLLQGIRDTKKTLVQVGTYLPKAEQIVSEMNRIHNNLWVKDIDWRKSLRSNHQK